MIEGDEGNNGWKVEEETMTKSRTDLKDCGELLGDGSIV